LTGMPALSSTSRKAALTSAQNAAAAQTDSAPYSLGLLHTTSAAPSNTLDCVPSSAAHSQQHQQQLPQQKPHAPVLQLTGMPDLSSTSRKAALTSAPNAAAAHSTHSTPCRPSPSQAQCCPTNIAVPASARLDLPPAQDSSRVGGDTHANATALHAAADQQSAGR
jgi:hypothetical protein